MPLPTLAVDIILNKQPYPISSFAGTIFYLEITSASIGERKRIGKYSHINNGIELVINAEFFFANLQFN